MASQLPGNDTPAPPAGATPEISVSQCATAPAADHPPTVSVVVATYNRADFLARTLRSLLRQTIPHGDFEIIVVDNNSTDGTRELVAKYCSRHSSIRYMWEPNQGVSWSRNQGLRAAKASIVAFIDDDAVAADDWLANALHCFGSVEPRPQIVGGAIHAFFLGRRPSWVWNGFMSCTWGDHRRFLSPGECFYGSNMFLRPQALPAVGGFSTSLGVSGDTLLLGEEDRYFEVLWEALGPDARFYYDPSVRVFHAVPQSRATVKYAIRRAFAEGQTMAVWVRERSPETPWLHQAHEAEFKLRRDLREVVADASGAASLEYWMAHDLARVAKRTGRLLWVLGIRPTMRRV